MICIIIHIVLMLIKLCLLSINLSKSDSNCTHTLYHMIYVIFTYMLIHGVSHGDLLLSTLEPIPKNKRVINVILIIIDKKQ